VRDKRRLFLLSVAVDLIAIFVAAALGVEPWLVVLVAVAALSPSLFMVVWMTARIRSEDNPSSEAQRLGHHDLVPECDTRP
jgi:Flp pilus assembly protein TadB